MEKNNVTAFVSPGEFRDPLTEVLREGARKLLADAVEFEVEALLAAHAHLRTEDGRQRVVRHGHLPERPIQTGIGAVPVRKPRVRDRAARPGDKIAYTSALLPPYIRRSKSLEELIPALYLQGVSTGSFQDALKALLGEQAPGLSPETIRRLKDGWEEDWEAWRRRDLSARRYVYFWADGVYLNARMDDRQCLLVIIGATPEGKKELVGFTDGYRESAQSWRELLLDLKTRGLTVPPELAVGDGAMGFWAALAEVFGQSRQQRCWVHKTANVLNKMPKSLQARAKADLQDIWMAEGRKDAEAAFDLFVEKYGAKYDKATDCLTKDREVLLTFYDFPAQHWKHIRTTNPIESTFATVRLRTERAKGCLSRKTALAMAFKLVMAAQKRWRTLSGPNQLPKLVEGVTFNDGIEVIRKKEQQSYAA
jgi:transposase-like protein